MSGTQKMSAQRKIRTTQWEIATNQIYCPCHFAHFLCVLFTFGTVELYKQATNRREIHQKYVLGVGPIHARVGVMQLSSCGKYYLILCE